MDKKSRILIVDDEKINRLVLLDLLKIEYEVLVAKSGEEALEIAMMDYEIDLILLDVVMPGISGYDVLKRLKEIEKTKSIPVIFITALSSLDDEEKGLKLGAADYIVKPFRPSIVKLRISNYIQSVKHRKLLEELIGRDGLTGINNRRHFDNHLIKEWRRTRRSEMPISIIMIDVDYFKKYNDYYGHANGDIALKSVANTILNEMKRPGDFVARYGGEEFVVIIPDVGLSGGVIVAEKIRKAVEKLNIPHEDSNISNVLTISLGVSTFNKDYKSPDELVKKADEMLYKAKANGRNRVAYR